VINNTCYENVRAGIGISEHSRPIVRGNTCYKNRRAGIGIRTGEETQPVVEYNECYENDMAGIGNRDDARPIIRHNKCYNNRMAGIGSRDGARAVIEHNECFENGMAGIGSRLGAAPVIRHNRCYRNTMAGIGSREEARPVIEDNECFENKMAGIGSQQDAQPVIRRNRCYRNEMAGIGSRLGARPVIVDNECFENDMAGIGSREGAAPVIRSNRTHDNDMAGISSRQGSRPVIVDNESHTNYMAGIGVRDAATVAVIIGNRCLENRLVAVGVPDGATALIHGNELKRTEGGAPPMVALRGGSNAVVSDNVIHGGGVAGVLVSGFARISGNQFLGRGPDKQGSAIWVPFGGSFDFSSTVVASNNRSNGYRNLINANKSNVTVTGNTTSNFRGPAIIVANPSVPARVFGNVAISDNPKDTAADVDGAEDSTATNVLKKTADIDKSRFPDAPTWPLLSSEHGGETFHTLANTGKQVTVEEGLWKLVVTYGETRTYALFHTKDDPQSKNGFIRGMMAFIR
jgi:parallel beta-helix repeat protein